MTINEIKQRITDQNKPLYVWVDVDGLWQLIKVVDVDETDKLITLTLKGNEK